MTRKSLAKIRPAEGLDLQRWGHFLKAANLAHFLLTINTSPTLYIVLIATMTGRQAATTLLRTAAPLKPTGTTSSSLPRLASTSSSSAATRTPPHLLSLADLSSAQIASVLESAIEFKSAFRSTSLALPESSRKQLSLGESPIVQSLKNKSIAIMFSKRSTRTRVASETSVASLGGTGLFLAPSDIQLGVNESLYDTAKVVSSMVDGIMARVGGHDEVEVSTVKDFLSITC